MGFILNNLAQNTPAYQKAYQKRLAKRLFLEGVFGFVVMYLGCKIHPTSVLPAQPVVLSSAVVFALYSIRGYRISLGLFLGGILAYYFSPLTSHYVYLTSKILASMGHALQILFCAFFMRYMLDKCHMALVSMRNLKEMLAYILVALIAPQLAFNILITPSVDMMITGLGHTVGILCFSSVFLVWDAYVPKVSPPLMPKLKFLLCYVLWFTLASLSYLYCDKIYHLPKPLLSADLAIIMLSYIALMLLFITLLSRLSNRFMSVIGMSLMGLGALAYAILHPEFVASHELNTLCVQIGVVLISAYWLKMLAALR